MIIRVIEAGVDISGEHRLVAVRTLIVKGTLLNNVVKIEPLRSYRWGIQKVTWIGSGSTMINLSVIKCHFCFKFLFIYLREMQRERERV